MSMTTVIVPVRVHCIGPEDVLPVEQSELETVVRLREKLLVDVRQAYLDPRLNFSVPGSHWILAYRQNGTDPGQPLCFMNMRLHPGQGFTIGVIANILFPSGHHVKVWPEEMTQVISALLDYASTLQEGSQSLDSSPMICLTICVTPSDEDTVQGNSALVKAGFRMSSQCVPSAPVTYSVYMRSMGLRSLMT